MAKFDYNDVVRAIASADQRYRPGDRAWIVGVFENDPSPWLRRFPPGVVYSIEYEDGSSLEIHETLLELDPTV